MSLVTYDREVVLVHQEFEQAAAGIELIKNSLLLSSVRIVKQEEWRKYVPRGKGKCRQLYIKGTSQDLPFFYSI